MKRLLRIVLNAGTVLSLVVLLPIQRSRLEQSLNRGARIWNTK
jgi:hypothetical protein